MFVAENEYVSTHNKSCHTPLPKRHGVPPLYPPELLEDEEFVNRMNAWREYNTYQLSQKYNSGSLVPDTGNDYSTWGLYCWHMALKCEQLEAKNVVKNVSNLLQHYQSLYNAGKYGMLKEQIFDDVFLPPTYNGAVYDIMNSPDANVRAQAWANMTEASVFTAGTIYGSTKLSSSLTGKINYAKKGLDNENVIPKWKRYEMKHGGQQTYMRTNFNGKQVTVCLDKPPGAKRIMEFKDYNWSNPRYKIPFIQQKVIQDFQKQILKYQTIRPEVHLQFSQKPPLWVTQAIKDVGGTYNVIK